MTIIQEVRDVLEANAGTAMTTAEIEANLKGVTKSQINSALWRLRTEEDLIKQVRTGVHKYLGPSERSGRSSTAIEIPTPNTIQDAIDAREAFEQEKPEDCKFFTRVGLAENGDIIITRDSDAKTYRATPL